ncbi:uncharacterized protein LAESUDRAFT_667862, partial [Laetiporus sulphureus 93-53]
KIRIHASRMLGREFVDSPIPVVSHEEVQAFEMKKHVGPSRADFRVHLAGSPNSKWNKQAAAAFSEDFMNTGWSDCQDRMKIQRMFTVHLNTLRAQYKKQSRGDQEPTEAELDRLTEENREHRRRALRQRRSNAIGTHADLARFQRFWDTIPYTAMSGDESDHSRGKVRYVVTRLRWRSAGLEKWLRVFDWMHLSSRFTAEGKPRRGAFPRYRRRGSNRLERLGDPVPGLPQNCYDAMWFAGLNEEERSSLNVQPALDLAHSEAVLAFVALPHLLMLTY